MFQMAAHSELGKEDSELSSKLERSFWLMSPKRRPSEVRRSNTEALSETP